MTKDEALRLALEALEYEAQKGNDNAYQFEREAIKAALEAKDEPVAWCSQCGHKCPQTVNQEPVGWWDAKIGFFEEKHFDQLCPLYTTPPAAQRTWVGLTDEEVNTIYEQAEVLVNDSWVGNGTVGLMFPITLYKMFEAKLKEKNT
jgi:hypothetical protein